MLYEEPSPYSEKNSSLQVADGGGAVTQPLQEFQQTVASVVSPPIAKKRLVNDPVVLVQEEPTVKLSWSLHPSTVNLYSIESCVNGSVTIQTPSPSESSIALQLPHHPLKLPLTNTPLAVEPPYWFMSTAKVTLLGVAGVGHVPSVSQEPKQNRSVVSCENVGMKRSFQFAGSAQERPVIHPNHHREQGY